MDADVDNVGFGHQLLQGLAGLNPQRIGQVMGEGGVIADEGAAKALAEDPSGSAGDIPHAHQAHHLTAQLVPVQKGGSGLFDFTGDDLTVSQGEAAEKREILARLQAHRKTNGLGCFTPLAKACGKGITATTLRNMNNGDEVYPIDMWRQVSKGLDKLEGPVSRGSGG